MHRSSSAALCAAALASAAAGQEPDSPSTADWKRGAVCYEIFVRSFYDSDGDGIGDLHGLIEKLDYINDGTPDAGADLGARCIWLMPIASSPSYHGYDATDYYRVDPEYGTNDDFRRLIAEAHRRGIRVLVDMVLNHASSEHPFFKHALQHADSPYRDWFRWSAADPGTQGPWGQVVWHRSPVRDEYYYGIFWHGMPDLNYENAAVRAEAKRIATFWLDSLGADGFRLDAIPYLVEEGGRLAHTPGTHVFLRDYAAHVRTVAPDAFTVGEVWDSVQAMLPYYPDQLDAHFAFAASDAILRAVASGSADALFAPYLQLQSRLPHERWAPFLRNHDQTRTLTALGGDIARAKLAATLLLTLPGLPFVYYGEEIGMTGDKPDPRLRTPMHWTRAPAAGFTTGVPWEPLQPDSFTANVEVQARDPGSLLHLYRHLIQLRGGSPALSRGELVPLNASDHAAAAYLRRAGDSAVLVVANLGSAPLSGVTVSSAGRVLPPGTHATRDLLNGSSGPPVRVDGSGRLGSVALPPLGAAEVRVFLLLGR
jgi:glycosidase